MMSYILLLIGFVLLIKGADVLVDGGAALAKRLSVSNIVIGLTIVAFGTSAPESVVTILASARGESDLALANIVGSVVTNILLGIGIAAVIFPLKVQRATVWKEIPFSIFAVLVMLVLLNDQWTHDGGVSQLSWLDGVVLLVFFVMFMYYAFQMSRRTDTTEPRVETIASDMSVLKSIIFILLGIVGLFLGGKLIVDNAVIIAVQLGISQTIIGLIITGPGTSLPEITATAMAARKKQVDLAIGGIVGSNIFNILFILGISAIVGPLIYNPILLFDLLLILGASILLFSALFIGKRHRIDRWQGAGFIVLYILYVMNLFVH